MEYRINMEIHLDTTYDGTAGTFYIWKAYNAKIEIISFVIKILS
jgi:hypothetical protein